MKALLLRNVHSNPHFSTYNLPTPRTHGELTATNRDPLDLQLGMYPA